MDLERNYKKENIFLLQKLNASQAEEVALRALLDDAYEEIEQLKQQNDNQEAAEK